MNNLFIFFKKIIEECFYFCYVLLNPSYWIQHHPYSKSYDKKLNDYLLRYDFENADTPYYAKLGDLTIWIANHPYASYTIRYRNDFIRPSRRTIAKAHKKMVNNKIYIGVL